MSVPLVDCQVHIILSFDNSGQRLKDGPLWNTNKTDIARSNNVVKTIANMFKDQTDTVPIIAPLNELSARIAISSLDR